jgi:hypothetical protein
METVTNTTYFCVTLTIPQIQMTTADEMKGQNVFFFLWAYVTYTKDFVQIMVFCCHHTIFYVDIKIFVKYIPSIFTLTEAAHSSNTLVHSHTITQ